MIVYLLFAVVVVLLIVNMLILCAMSKQLSNKIDALAKQIDMLYQLFSWRSKAGEE